MSDRVKIERGITGSAQEGSFMNATLQAVEIIDGTKYVDPVLDMSIATYLQVPQEYVRDEGMTAEYVESVLSSIASAYPGITFEVQIGPYGNGPDEEAIADPTLDA